MSMIKYVSPSGWEWDRPVAMPIPISSRGLVGSDRSNFIKSAGHLFLDEVDNIKFAKDEVPVHIVALGASEAYGPNRNGDGFKEATCRKHHQTFEKFAKFFRNHKNKPERGDPHFGIIKKSVYNEPMKRVELLVALNQDRSAADRNGGFVADQELEKLARGDDIAVSMACRVPYDICSWCGNQAKTRADYCTTEKCAAGGCQSNLTRLIKVGKDMHHLHVDNPNPTWFDISRVFRPADRIAYGAKADYLTKAAADNGLFELNDYIKMAEADSAPLHVIMYQESFPGIWNEKIASQVKLAYGLSKLERSSHNPNEEIYRAFDTPPFDVEELGALGTTKCAEGLGALADQKIILHIKDWARLANKTEHVKEASKHLPKIYTKLVDSNIESRVELNPYPLSEKIASADQRKLASSCRSSHSLDKEAVADRSMRSSLRGEALPAVNLSNVNGVSEDAEKLAVDYAIYKLAALSRIAASDEEFPLTARLCVSQNHT